MLVGAVHLWLAEALTQDSLGLGAAPAMRRMQVSFVRALVPQAPPATALSPPRRAPRPVAALRAAVTSLDAPPAIPEVVVAGADLIPEVAPAAADAASAPLPTAAAVDAAAAPPSSVAAPSAVPNAASPFEWPPSTRLSYTLTGNFRGPVQGQAQVEWLQRGGRYQVHLEVSVGPALAPLVARRMSSEGEVTADGLKPRRYEEQTRMLLRPPRLLVIELEPERITLANGQQGPRPAGVQDSASQFVQMTWLFTLNPQLMQPGASIEMPLALPRRVEPWTYEVAERQTLQLPLGALDTLHVRPRRAAREGDLTAEFWVAPSLQNLPVRILIRQDEQTYVDLVLLRLPQQAEEPADERR